MVVWLVFVVGLFSFQEFSYGENALPTGAVVDVQDNHCDRLFRSKTYMINRRLMGGHREDLRWLVPWLDNRYDGCAIESIMLSVKANQANSEIELLDGYSFVGFPERVSEHWHTIRFDLFFANQPLYQENIALRARGEVELQSISIVIK